MCSIFFGGTLVDPSSTVLNAANKKSTMYCNRAQIESLSMLHDFFMFPEPKTCPKKSMDKDIQYSKLRVNKHPLLTKLDNIPSDF